MSKIYCYNNPIYQGDAIIGNEVIEMTEQQILDEYWDNWSSRMIAKFGEDDEDINEEECIDCWISIHWAWEK